MWLEVEFYLFVNLVYLFVCFFFFFSSRRRHTRYIGDWSSDVCSSDLELAGINRRRRVGHEVHCRGGLGEGDDFADGLFSGQKRHHAVKPQRDAAVGRGAIGERVEEKPEALSRLLVRQPQRPEHARLDVLAVNPDTAGAQLDAVQHQVVALRAHFPRRGLELVQVLLDDSSKRVLRAHPAVFGLAPLKQGKTSEPEKLPAVFRDEFQLLGQVQAQLPGNQRRGFGAFDLLFRGDGHDQVARSCAHSFGQFLDLIRAKNLFQRRRNALRSHLDGIEPGGAKRFGALGQLIELLPRIRSRDGRRQRKDGTFDVQRLPRLSKKRGNVLQLHAEAQVGFVNAVAAYGLAILHAGKWRLDF